MTIEEIKKICESLPGVTTDIKWENHLCFNVGDKMFLITGPDQVPPTASFKVTPEDFDLLTERKGITPAAYLARYKWVYTDDIGNFSKAEWEKHIATSYHLVFEKLPAKVRKEIR